MADQICYAVLCVFSYVAAGSDKKFQLPKPPPSLDVQVTTAPEPLATTQEEPELLADADKLRGDVRTEFDMATMQIPVSPEPGTVTPVGGPPAYPPPALPPGVQPPAPPPGKVLTSRPNVPPPVPHRQGSVSTGAPPPPPRPK